MKGPEDRQFAKFRLTGSPRALGAVYDLVAPELLQVATHLASDPADAEDLVQRTFVTAIEKSKDFKGGERVLPWLLGILAFHAKNEKRRSSRRPDPTRLSERTPGKPDVDAESQELKAQLAKAMGKLPEEQRSVLTLRLSHNLSAAEIAHALGRPPGTVRSQLARGMETLRNLLPAGLVASAVLALGLPRGLSAIREGLVRKATSTPFPKLLAAKGYCTLALAPIAEVLLMKKALAAVLLLGAFLGTRAFLDQDAVAPTPALNPSDAGTPLPLASISEAEAKQEPQANTRRALALALEEVTKETDLEEQKPKLGDLRLAVVDHAGAPVANEVCVVTYNHPSSPGPETRVVRMDAGGVAQLAELTAGYVRVQTLRGSDVTDRIRNGKTTEIEIRLPLGLEVHGDVVDGLGNSIPHARIWLSKRHFNREGYEAARADGAGHFRLQSVNKDNYVAAHAPGYAISYLQTPSGTPGESSDMRIVLDTVGGQVEVQVTDLAGQPIDGAQVVIGDLRTTPYRDLGNGFSAPPPPARRGRTDETGRVTITSVPIGESLLWVQSPTFGLGREHVLIRANSPAMHSIALLPQAEVVGRVTSPDGTPIARAAVWFGTRHRFDSRTCYADRDGQFRLDGLPAGDLQIHAEVSGYGLVEHPVNLSPGEERQLDIVMEEQPYIHGKLLSTDEQPLAGHVVVAMDEDGRRMVDSDRTTAQGSFRLLVEPGVHHTLFAYPQGELSGFPLAAVKGKLASPEAVRLKVPDRANETVRLHVQVQRPDGPPCEGATLQMHHKELNLFRFFETQVHPGVFELSGLLPGTVDLTLRHADFQRLRLAPVELMPGETVDLGVQEFAPVCRVVGRFNGLIEGSLPANAQFLIGQQSGGHGRFEILGATFKSSPLAPGEHQISLLADHFLPIYKVVDLQPGEDLELTLDLVPAGMHLVRVQTAEGDSAPQWIGASAKTGEGALGWSGVMSKQEDGSFLARVSALPGKYRFEAESPDGRTVSTEIEIHSLRGEAQQSDLRLSALAD